MKRRLEDIIKQKESGFRKDPPEDLWSGIAKELDSKRRRILWWRFLVVGVCGVFLSAGAYWTMFGINSNDTKPKQVVQNTSTLEDKNKQTRTTTDSAQNPTKGFDSTMSSEPFSTHNSGRLSMSEREPLFPADAGQHLPENMQKNDIASQQKNTEIPAGNSNKILNSAADSLGVSQEVSVSQTATDSAGKVNNSMQEGSPIAALPPALANTDSADKSTNEKGKKEDDKKGKFQPQYYLGLGYQTAFALSGKIEFNPTNPNAEYPPFYASFDPSTPVGSGDASAYKNFRDSTDITLVFGAPKFLFGAEFTEHWSLETGLSFLSIGRRIRGGEDFVAFEYRPSTEGEILVDTNIHRADYTPDEQYYFTPFGTHYRLVRYNYLSVPVMLQYRFHAGKKVGLYFGAGLEWNLRWANEPLYFYDYNNFRYLSLNKTEQKAFYKNDIWNFSLESGFQYRFKNSWQAFGSIGYKGFLGSVHTSNSYYKEYYKLVTTSFGVKYYLQK